MEIRLEALNKLDGWDRDLHCLIMNLEEEKKNETRSLHYHEYIEFLYGIKGVATVTVGNRICKMEKGDLVMINNREPHTVWCDEGSAEYYVIKFLPQILYSQCQSIEGVRYLLPLWQKEIAYLPILRESELSESNINALIADIFKEWKEKSHGYELVVKANIMQVFVWLLRNKCPISRLSDEKIPRSLYGIMKGVLEECERRMGNMTSEEAAAFANLSYSYFSRNFKKIFGISFSEYSMAIRLREGERMLLTTDKDITEISYALSFGTTSHFIECFRKKYGLTPHKFRKEMQASEKG